jgi:hypothetical protein
MITTRAWTRYLAVRPDGRTVELPMSCPLKAGWRLAIPEVAIVEIALTVPPTTTGEPSRADDAGHSGDGRTTALTVDSATETT